MRALSRSRGARAHIYTQNNEVRVQEVLQGFGAAEARLIQDNGDQLKIEKNDIVLKIDNQVRFCLMMPSPAPSAHPFVRPPFRIMSREFI